MFNENTFIFYVILVNAIIDVKTFLKNKTRYYELGLQVF